MEWTRERRYEPIENVSEEELNKLIDLVNGCPFRQGYHIQPPTGLLNDPNGFSFYNGEYHLFYQWYPRGPVHGLKYWYHTSSKDLVNWENKGIAINPNNYFDSHGAFSGSAIVHENKLHLLYTGNTRDENWDRVPYQCLAIMDDKNIVTKHDEPIISGQHQGYTDHFRDPKVFKMGDNFYLVIGAQNNDLKGRVVYYKSKDLINWEFVGEINTSLNDFGFMWECPDYIEIDEKGILIFSPQGLEQDGEKYANIYQSGYILGEKLNLSTGDFNHGEFIELDNGFDFYAPQTTEDNHGRKILVGWMGLPEIEYPTDKNGWAHCLTLPRELSIVGDKLIQKPVKELELLRGNHRSIKANINSLEKSFDGFNGERYELNCRFNNFTSGKVGLKLRVSENEETVIYYDVENKKITLDRSKSGEVFATEWGTTRSTSLDCSELSLQVFVDNSSVEIFVNNGEKVFTSRVFPSSDSTGIRFLSTGSCDIEADMWII